MDDIEPSRILLPSIHVQWSDEQAAFLAWSEQCPGLTCADPWSSLAAVDGLIEAAGSQALGYRLPPPGSQLAARNQA